MYARKMLMLMPKCCRSDGREKAEAMLALCAYP